MGLTQLFVLGIVQGFTEFLPISSSAHLILLPLVFEWKDQGLAYDIAAHVGTLTAIIFYFRRDLARMIPRAVNARDPEGRTVWLLAASTLPIVIAGFAFRHLVGTEFRNPLLIAATTFGFGLVLWWADRSGSRTRSEAALGWRDAILIGVAQCLAIVPGTSRSGITITAGLMLGLERDAAARFSFLLSIPTIGLAGAYEAWLLFTQSARPDWGSMGVVTLVSAVVAFITVHYFLKFLNRTGMLPYVIYRVLLGIALFALFY